MENIVSSHAALKAMVRTRTRSYIPIRSITYKKEVSEIVEQENRKQVATTLQNFFKDGSKSGKISHSSPNNHDSVSTTLPKKPEEIPRSNPNISVNTNPFMNTSYHQLNFGSPRLPKTTKGLSAALPSIKNMKISGCQSTRNDAVVQNSKVLMRQHTRGLKETAEKTAQEDYFKLLVDPNRKTFQVQDFEGVDEYYTNEIIMSRIHKQGYRDYSYYSTKPKQVDMEIPHESEIRENFRFKISPVISTLENPSTLATHVLGGTWNNIEYVELAIQTSKNEIGVIKEEKLQVESDVEVIKEKFEKEIQEVEEDFLKRFEKLQSLIKEDFIAIQSENFRHQKEISILKRDRIKLEQEIEALVPPLQELDKVLYGRDMFELIPNENNLGMIKSMNIRPDVQVSLKYSQIIH